jgi:hypothetical protein
MWIDIYFGHEKKNSNTSNKVRELED